MSQAKELERIITILDTAWDTGEPCVLPLDTEKWILDQFNLDLNDPVPNANYDDMRIFLKSIAPNSSLFDTPSASTHVPTKKIKHHPAMVSIEKASHEKLPEKEEMLFDWINHCVVNSPASLKKSKVFDLDEKDLSIVDPKTLEKTKKTKHHEKREYKGNIFTYPRDYFAMSYKLDGVGAALYYENGKLVAAGKRPRNGIEGEDVTEQIKHVENVPQQLPLPITCSIRGEILSLLSNFKIVADERSKKGEDPLANPRACAVGGMNQRKNPAETKNYRLTFIAHGIEGYDNPPYKTEIEKAKWCNQTLKIRFVRTTPFNFYVLEDLEAHVPHLDYWVDGVIISVDNLDNQEQLGRHGDKSTGNPRGKIAWKFREEEAQPIVKEIEWNTGRTGKITPVTIFDKVELAGTQVGRATLHNAGALIRNKIGVGTKIRVTKGGSIIPKIIGVAGNPISGEPPYPKQCPTCKEPTELIENTAAKTYTAELVCNNPHCPAQALNRLCFYLKTIGCLGLAESKVSQLKSAGKVKTPPDFYKLTIQDCIDAGLSERQSLLAMATIHMIPSADQLDDKDLKKSINSATKKKKKIPFYLFFASLGIPGAGESTGQALIDHFHNFDTILATDQQTLKTVAGIGKKTAESIHQWLNVLSKDIDALLKHIEPELPKIGKLTGQVFCLSGSFDEGKKHWEDKIVAEGGKVTGNVSKKATYLVAGPGSVGKTEKAQELGIPIIGVDTLQKML